MKITKRQLRRIIKEEKQKLLNENVPSAVGMEILSIKDALVDILTGVRYHDDELAEDLELQIDRLRTVGYKRAYRGGSKGPPKGPQKGPGAGGL